MKIADIPPKFSIPFGNAAGVGYIRDIPTTPTGVVGQASLQEGFPPANFNPVSAGGVPPFGQDMNGLLKQATGWNRWQATGAFPLYDPTFQTNIGGYPSNSCVASLVTTPLIWMSIVDDNTTNPDAGGAGWISFFRPLTQNTDLYVNGATGNDTNNGLTPATAKATLQSAVDAAWNFAPSQYAITIHMADGTYAGAATPTYPGPTLIIEGNSSNPSSVVISYGANHAISARGPNSVTVRYLKVQTGTGGTPACGFVAGLGAILTNFNTVSGFCEGGVFYAAGATIIAGTHRFEGNSTALFWAASGGTINLIQNANYTVGTNITVSNCTVRAEQSGSIFSTTPNPAWSLLGTVSGSRYAALLNGTINTQGAGTSYFPGSSAGTLTTGGQYA